MMVVNFLKKARVDAGLTLEEVSERLAARDITLSPGQLSRLERGESDIPAERLRQLAGLYGWSAGELLDGRGPNAPETPPPYEMLPPPDDRPPLAASLLPDPPPQPMLEDDRRRDNPLPVWASAEGGDSGAMLITTGPIDWIPRPRSLEVKNAFAVYLIGDSMSPAYEHGDQLYVHPHRPPQGGNDCLFIRELEDGTLIGLVKRLLRRTADKWRVRQFNPGKDFDLPRDKWPKAWVIVGKMNHA